MKLTEAECEKLAEEVVDQVVGPSMPAQWHQWAMQRHFDAFDKLGMFPSPVMVINDQPVYAEGEVVDDRRRTIDREYTETMRKLERKEIVPLLKAWPVCLSLLVADQRRNRTF